MAMSSCFLSSQARVSFRLDRARFASNTSCNNNMSQRISVFANKSMNTKFWGLGKEVSGWSFLGGSRNICRPSLGTSTNQCRKRSAVKKCTYCSRLNYFLTRLCPITNFCGLPNSQIASNAFTLGTAAVLPFYTFMVVAPRANFTKKLVTSSIPFVVLGILYSYLLYLSWTPDTIRWMFASKYWLPELPGIAKMFSSEMTLASAWIHLLTVDLYAARQVYLDGLQENVETKHSVSLCLLFCPIGILSHFITKGITRSRGRERTEHGIH